MGSTDAARRAGYMAARRLDKAIATYTEVIRRKPGFAEGWNRGNLPLGSAYVGLALLAEADVLFPGDFFPSSAPMRRFILGVNLSTP